MESAFFWISKLTWLVISPDSLLLILVLLAWVLLWRGVYRGAKWLLSFVAVSATAIALFPVGEWLLYPLETRFPTNPELPSSVDGIIVLSGAEDPVLSSVWNQVEMGQGAERNLAFHSLARRYPDAKLVFTGGTGSMLHPQYKAADVAKMLFEEQGLALTRITFERHSKNTYENAVLSKAQVRPDPDETWILITTAWHMPRSVGVFCMAGWSITPYPVDHRSTPGDLLRIEWAFAEHLGSLNSAVREWLGLLVYYITRKTTALFPDRCDT